MSEPWSVDPVGMTSVASTLDGMVGLLDVPMWSDAGVGPQVQDATESVRQWLTAELELLGAACVAAADAVRDVVATGTQADADAASAARAMRPL